MIPPQKGAKKFAPTGAYVDIDFKQMSSKQIQAKCGGNSLVIVGHELGHLDLAFTRYRLFIILAKANAMAATHPDLLFKGLPFDELYTIAKYEDPLRSSLGIPPVLSPQDTAAGLQHMKDKGIPLP